MRRFPFPHIFYLLAFLALLLGACATPAASPPRSDMSGAVPQAPSSAGSGTSSEYAPNTGGNPDSIQRIVLKDATISLVVDDPIASMNHISALTQGMNGYVVSAQTSQVTISSGAEAPQAKITVRVPAERLDEALAQIRKESREDPLYEDMQSQDVTSDYVDLQSQLKNLQAAEKQLQGIMDQAKTTDEVLSVYKQLTDVRGQIEVLQGKINYYDQASALSSIDITLNATESIQPLSIGGWQPVGTARDALQALINTVKFLGNAAIWIAILIIPTLILIILPLYVLIRILKAVLNRKPKQPRPVMPPPPPAAPPAR